MGSFYRTNPNLSRTLTRVTRSSQVSSSCEAVGKLGSVSQKSFFPPSFIVVGRVAPRGGSVARPHLTSQTIALFGVTARPRTTSTKSLPRFTRLPSRLCQRTTLQPGRLPHFLALSNNNINFRLENIAVCF